MKNLRILESPKSEAPPPLPSSSYVEPVASSVKPKPNIKVKHQKPSIKIKEEFKLKQEYDSDNGVSNGNVFYNITEQVMIILMSEYLTKAGLSFTLLFCRNVCDNCLFLGIYSKL